MAYTTREEIDAMYTELNEALDPRRMRKQKIKRKISIAGNIIFAVIVILLILILITIEQTKESGEIPNILGYNFCYVETGSMEPTINIGAIIYGKVLQEDEEVEIGDVVTFKDTKGVRITHRIVSAYEDKKSGEMVFRTRGDNPENDTDREILTRDRIISIVKGVVPFTN